MSHVWQRFPCGSWQKNKKKEAECHAQAAAQIRKYFCLSIFLPAPFGEGRRWNSNKDFTPRVSRLKQIPNLCQLGSPAPQNTEMKHTEARAGNSASCCFSTATQTTQGHRGFFLPLLEAKCFNLSLHFPFFLLHYQHLFCSKRCWSLGITSAAGEGWKRRETLPEFQVVS